MVRLCSIYASTVLDICFAFLGRSWVVVYILTVVVMCFDCDLPMSGLYLTHVFEFPPQKWDLIWQLLACFDFLGQNSAYFGCFCLFFLQWFTYVSTFFDLCFKLFCQILYFGGYLLAVFVFGLTVIDLCFGCFVSNVLDLFFYLCFVCAWSVFRTSWQKLDTFWLCSTYIFFLLGLYFVCFRSFFNVVFELRFNSVRPIFECLSNNDLTVIDLSIDCFDCDIPMFWMFPSCVSTVHTLFFSCAQLCFNCARTMFSQCSTYIWTVLDIYFEILDRRNGRGFDCSRCMIRLCSTSVSPFSTEIGFVWLFFWLSCSTYFLTFLTKMRYVSTLLDLCVVCVWPLFRLPRQNGVYLECFWYMFWLFSTYD